MVRQVVELVCPEEERGLMRHGFFRRRRVLMEDDLQNPDKPIEFRVFCTINLCFEDNQGHCVTARAKFLWIVR